MRCLKVNNDMQITPNMTKTKFLENLEKALRLQVGGNRRLGYLLIKMGFISEEQLHSVLSQSSVNGASPRTAPVSKSRIAL